MALLFIIFQFGPVMTLRNSQVSTSETSFSLLGERESNAPYILKHGTAAEAVGGRAVENGAIAHRYQLAANIGKIGVWEWDLTSDQFFWDAQAVAHLNADGPGDLHATEDVIWHFYNADRDQPLATAIDRALKSGAALDFEIRVMLENGECRHVEFRAKVIRDRKLAPIRLSGITTDVTDTRMQARELDATRAELESFKRKQSLFHGKLGHEIRAALNISTGYINILKSNIASGPESTIINKIQFANEQLASMASNLMSHACEELGCDKLHSVPGNICDIIKDTRSIGEMQADILGKNITISTRISKEIPKLLIFDPVKMRQIFTNLVNNAIKYTESGEISIDVLHIGRSDDRHKLEIRVADTGMGIEDCDFQELFEPFVRADMARNRRIDGTGLGLSIVRNLVTLMGGDIRVSSDPGKGSRFSITVELAEAQSDAVEPRTVTDKSSTRPKRLAGLRILVVDDCKINLEIAKTTLEMEGALVSLAHSGTECLSKLARDPAAIDAILLDMHMPGLDGRDTFSEIALAHRESRPRIIALTASSGPHGKPLPIVMDGHVAKPFSPDELVSGIVGALGHSGENACCHSMPDCAHWPTFDGIDWPEVQERMAGNLELFLILAQEFFEEFDAPNWQSSGRGGVPSLETIHKLKGSSALLGMNDVSATSALILEAMRGDGEISVPNTVEQLNGHLLSMKEKFKPFMD